MHQSTQKEEINEEDIADLIGALESISSLLLEYYEHTHGINMLAIESGNGDVSMTIKRNNQVKIADPELN